MNVQGKYNSGVQDTCIKIHIIVYYKINGKVEPHRGFQRVIGSKEGYNVLQDLKFLFKTVCSRIL